MIKAFLGITAATTLGLEWRKWKTVQGRSVHKERYLWKVWKMLYSRKFPSINCIFCSLSLILGNYLLFYYCFLGWTLLFVKGKNYLPNAFAVTHISFEDHSFYVSTWFCTHCNSNICEEVPLLLQCMGDLFSHPLSTITTCKLGVLVWFFRVYLIFFLYNKSISFFQYFENILRLHI